MRYLFDHTPGMRILKTGISIILCLLIDFARGSEFPYNAAISAIVCLQGNVETTYKTSINRLIGTFLAGLYAYLFLLIFKVRLGLDSDGLLFFMLVGVACIPLMQLMVSIHKPGAVGISAIVFLLISLTTMYHQAPLYATMVRVVDTSIGILVCLFVNWLPPVNYIGDKYEEFRNQHMHQGENQE